MQFVATGPLSNSSNIYNSSRQEQSVRYREDGARVASQQQDWETTATLPRSILISSPTALSPRPPSPSRNNALFSSPPVTFSNLVYHHSTSPSSSGGRSSTYSNLTEDILSAGDIIGEGVNLQGQVIRKVAMLGPHATADEPAKEFEVVRRLGHGSYAVVYLVKEILSGRPLNGRDSLEGVMDFEDDFPTEVRYGREFAVKCLSKANLDEEALANQMSEVTIHQSLKSHPNIVTHYRTLETPAFLLLLLEFVPGEDLFYFLEQSRDHFDPDTNLPSDARLGVSLSRTPPTPALLSTLHPTQLLSRTRLRLIASMFAQMCEAVSECHAQQVFHRDIKPENFIVTDGYTDDGHGGSVRKVVVKLTDFGLSTTDVESSDMDCGSAPYMSYECRNNVAPTYKPRAADVWSLGIVLMNMLYHFNPWTDTSDDVCPSFEQYRRDPIDFFMSRFTGMTSAVAEFLANRVFCLLSDPSDDSQRISAADFGLWVKDLPSHFSAISPSGHRRKVSMSSIHGYPIALSTPQSRRPSSRPPSVNQLRVPLVNSRPISRVPSVIADIPLISTIDMTVDGADGDEIEDGRESRSASKRRKRGIRGRNATPNSPRISAVGGASLPQNLETLARDISKAGRSQSRSGADAVVLETPLVSPIAEIVPTLPTISTPPPARPQIAKKPSKWKLSFGKSSASNEDKDDIVSAKGAAVSNILSTLQPASASTTNLGAGTSFLSVDPLHAGRGRRIGSPTNGVPPRRASPPTMYAGLVQEHWTASADSKRRPSPLPPTNRRGKSPATSVKTTKSVPSTPSTPVNVSNQSENWRTSMATTASAMTSTTTFTRFSNGSARSVATQATSVSASSWRSPVSKPVPVSPSPTTPVESRPRVMPSNVKDISGVPFAVDQFPTNFSGYTPNPRKQRTRRAKDGTDNSQLTTITESRSPPNRYPISTMAEAARSSVTLAEEDGSDDSAPKKVQRGQINALAKMLSALRR